MTADTRRPFAATASDRARGHARYTSDLVPKDTVVVGVARSPHAHARVVSVDATAALAIVGVLDVLTPSDVAGIDLGHQGADEPVLASVARYVGDGVAAVAAVSQEALLAGIDALNIEYERLPHAVTVDEGLALPTAIHAHKPDNVAQDFHAERGDWSAAKEKVAVWVEGTFETKAVAHAYLEPRATYVRVKPGHLELVAGTHFPSVLAEAYRHIVHNWGVELDIVTPDIGGSFGAKWEHPTHLMCLMLAHRLGRDVAMVLPRRDDMISGRTRVAMRLRVRIGATADGQLVAKETDILADNGAYSGHGPTVTMAATIRMDNLYRFAATRARSQLVYTNNMPSECFRGFGSPQSTFAQEQLIDELASRLNLDPFDIRRRNATGNNELTIHGWQVGSCGYTECLDAIESRIAADRDAHAQSGDERIRYGYGAAGCMHGISNRAYDPRFDRANVLIWLRDDGVIVVESAEVEIGCGTVDLLANIVAECLDISLSRIEVILGETATAPYGLGSFASRTAFFAGNAAYDACDRFLEVCATCRADWQMPESTCIANILRAAVENGRHGTLTAIGSYEPIHVAVPDSSGYGNSSPAYTFAAHGCRVRVDTLTGQVFVEQYWAAHDTGAVLNHERVRGQVIGGVVQGLGFALSEENIVDANGQLLNPGYLDDRVATFADHVPIECIFTNTYEGEGPQGAKTIAEPPIIPVAACIANAVFDAIGVRQRVAPMTPERVWRALEDSRSN